MEHMHTPPPTLTHIHANTHVCTCTQMHTGHRHCRCRLLLWLAGPPISSASSVNIPPTSCLCENMTVAWGHHCSGSPLPGELVLLFYYYKPENSISKGLRTREGDLVVLFMPHGCLLSLCSKAAALLRLRCQDIPGCPQTHVSHCCHHWPGHCLFSLKSCWFFFYFWGKIKPYLFFKTRPRRKYITFLQQQADRLYYYFK